jgi:cysteine sulfinate desulfinase/cysteine desulfurase-like protein
MGAVRFSLGRATTWEELEEVLDRLRSNLSKDKAGRKGKDMPREGRKKGTK